MTILLQGAGPQATTSTPADPIGDTLRADAVAYYKLDETSGTRADATGHGWNLPEYLTVPAVAGKIGNAAYFHDSTDDSGDLERVSFAMDLSSGFTVTGWIWTPGLTNNNTINIIRCFASPVITSISLYMENFASSNTQLFEGWADSVGSVVLPLNQWFYFRFWKTDASALTAYIQVNHGEVREVTSVAYSNPNAMLMLNKLSYTTDTDYYYLDECGLFARPLTDDEDAYLYNSGAGRALFP